MTRQWIRHWPENKGRGESPFFLLGSGYLPFFLVGLGAGFVCESALPATDLLAALKRLSVRILEAFVATFGDVCFLLVGIVKILSVKKMNQFDQNQSLVLKVPYKDNVFKTKNVIKISHTGRPVLLE